MNSKETFDIKGFEDLEEKLLALELEDSDKVLRAAGRYAMEPVLDDMKANVNVNSGDTKEALGIRVSKRSKVKNRILVVEVGAVKTTRKTAEGNRRKFVGPIGGKRRGTRKLNNSSINQRVIAQEFGNKRTKQKAFIRPAVDKNARQVFERLGNRVGEILKNIGDKK